MYIAPNSVIRILKNVPLDKTYEHTMFFGSATAQANTFIAYTKFLFNNQSYQRVNRGWIRVDRVADDLYDCNYLMFQNSAYGNKWFYAFIKSVEYINNAVSEIEFEIDVMQTWFFDYTLEPCFVEREHTRTDGLFEHLVEENLNVGEFYNAQIVRDFLFDCTLVCKVHSILGERSSEPIIPGGEGYGVIPVKPTVQGNLFTGVGYSSFDLKSDPDALCANIEQYVENGLEDGIILLFQYPRFIGRITSASTYTEIDYTFTPNFVNVDGYVPKNKKLFTYPYNYLSISDKEGNDIELTWEQWNTNHIGEFVIQGTAIGKPSVRVIPKYYRDIVEDFDNELTYDNFPVCAWSGDAYQVWLAQNRYTRQEALKGGLRSGASSIALGAAMSVVSPSSGAAMALHGAASVKSTILSYIASDKDARSKTPKTHGDPSSATLNIQSNDSGFEFKQMTIKQEYARIIDEYFSKFGYACHRVKIPNRNVRNKWTYTKTVGCNIIGSLPADDAEKICKIYDAGVTFWAYGITPGSYGDFTNDPIGS